MGLYDYSKYIYAIFWIVFKRKMDIALCTKTSASNRFDWGVKMSLFFSCRTSSFREKHNRSTPYVL